MAFSGMQMAIGTTINEPQMFGASKKQPIEPNPFVSIALFCAILGASLGFMTSSALAPATTGGAGALSLLLAKGYIDDQVLKQGHGMFQVSSEAGYVLSVVLFLFVVAWNAYLLWARSQRKQYATVGHISVESSGEPSG
jgi:hypothetical protein